MGYELNKDEMAVVLKPMYDDKGESYVFQVQVLALGALCR